MNLLDNQFLIAGALGALAYYGKSIFYGVWNHIKRKLIYTVTVDSYNNWSLYRSLSEFLKEKHENEFRNVSADIQH